MKYDKPWLLVSALIRVYLRFVLSYIQAIMDISFIQKIDCTGIREAPDIYYGLGKCRMMILRCNLPALFSYRYDWLSGDTMAPEFYN